MADAILYWRTTSNPAYSHTITQIPDAQKLTFDFPDNLAMAMQLSYQNNVVDIPVPIADGTRKINKQENGLKLIRLIIKGRFKKPINSSGDPILDTDIGKLISMSKMAQLDSRHPYGIIGFYSPNAPEFSLDPNATSTSVPATKGYTIDSWEIGYMPPKIKNYDFSVTLSFGGTW